MQIRVLVDDFPLLVRIQQHTGVRSHTELVRAALRAYMRELGLSSPSDVNANAAPQS